MHCKKELVTRHVSLKEQLDVAYVFGRFVVELQRLIDDADEPTDVLEVSRHLGSQHHVDHLLPQRLVIITARGQTTDVKTLEKKNKKTLKT